MDDVDGGFLDWALENSCIFTQMQRFSAAAAGDERGEKRIGAAANDLIARIIRSLVQNIAEPRPLLSDNETHRTCVLTWAHIILKMQNTRSLPLRVLIVERVRPGLLGWEWGVGCNLRTSGPSSSALGHHWVRQWPGQLVPAHSKYQSCHSHASRFDTPRILGQWAEMPCWDPIYGSLVAILGMREWHIALKPPRN